MEKSIYIISRIKGSLASFSGFLGSSFEEFLFKKNELTEKLEKYTPDEWSAFASPLEKHIEGLKVCTLFSYETPEIEEAIKEIKYHRNKRLAGTVSRFAAEFLASEIEEQLLTHPDMRVILIPIPSHRHDHNQKGFNQARDLAEALCLHLPFQSTVRNDILFKTKRTAHQTTLSRSARLTNLRGAFEAHLEKIDPHQTLFIIVDDVFTTGSTMREACTALSRRTQKERGALHLLPFTLARGGQ